MAFGERLRGYFTAQTNHIAEEKLMQAVTNAVKQSLENPNVSITEATLGSLTKSKSGATVTNDTVMQITAFWRAIQILGGVVASLPISVYRVTDTSAERLSDHPITRLIGRSPSPLYSKFNFMQTLILHLTVYGNFFAYIGRTGTGEVRTLKILMPERMKVKETSQGGVYYIYKQDSTKETRYSPDNILHISGLSWDGITGVEVLDSFKDTFGAAISSQDYVNNFYANGAHLSGVVEVPAKLDPEAYKRMRTSWKETYGGAHNAGATAILEQGAQYKKIGLSPVEAGIESAKKFTVSDISRITGVPQFLLEDLDRATFNNIEELGISFVKYTLYPLCRNIQSEFSRKLLPIASQDTEEIRIDLQSLLRADAESRAKRIDALMKWGIINRDEARSEEGLNPIPDGSGEKFYVPMNMVDPTSGQQLSLFGQNQTDNEPQPA